MIIQIDTREKPQAIEKILETFDACGVSYYRSKLYVGDYVDISNMFFVIDRKQGLEEIAGNLTNNHARFKQELERAKKNGIRMCILITCDNIKEFNDVKSWKNPRLKISPKAVTGAVLYKIMNTLMMEYDVYYEFCSEEEAGRKIIELLEREQELYELDRDK